MKGLVRASRWRWRAPALLAAAAALLGGGVAASAQTGQEAKWPCPQRYVAQLSAAALWTGPSLEEASKTWFQDEAVRGLVDKLADDTIEEAEATKAIDDFAASLGKDKDKKLVALFAGLFDAMNSERSRMMDAIKRFFERQEATAARTNKLNEQIRELEKQGKTGEEYLALRAEQAWANHVFDDRQRLVPYVCDEPVLLEQRLGTYARVIAGHLSPQKAEGSGTREATPER